MLGPDSKIRYIALAERQTLFAHRSQRTATHFTALQILLQAAEKLAEPSIVATLEMVLGPAVVGKHPGRAKAMVEVDEVFFMSDGEPSVGEL